MSSYCSIFLKTKEEVYAISRQYDSDDEYDDQSRFDGTKYKTKKGSEISDFEPYKPNSPDKNKSEEEGVDMRNLKRFLILGADTVYKAINEPERKKAKRNKKPKEENAKSNNEPKEENAKSNKELKEENAKSNDETKEENAKSNNEPKEENAKSNNEPEEEIAKSNKEPKEENAKSNKGPKKEKIKSSNEPKREHAKCIDRLIGEGKGKEVVEVIKNISLAGHAPKQIPTMYALAICARSNDADTKKAAYDALNEICRIPTHLFQFVKYCEEVSSGSGWGRAHRRGIIGLYANKAKNPKRLGRLLTKYKEREGWTHKDLFKLSHIKPDSDGLKVVIRYRMKGLEAAKELANEVMAEDDGVKELMAYLEGADRSRTCTDEYEMVYLIEKHGLEREHITTQLLNSKKVWESLLKNIKIMAVIRNLTTMTRVGLINDSEPEIQHCIVEKLTDENLLKKARVHPLNLLLTLKTYSKEHGDREELKWTPNPTIIKALDKAYYKSFAAVEPTNKRYLLAIDVSESMRKPCVGSNSISCRDAAAAMMMTTALTETNCDIVAFADTKLDPICIVKTDTLDQVVKKCSKIPPGHTDCALPMIWAMKKKKTYDVFIVYTAEEILDDKANPYRALQEYRNQDKKNKESKFIVVGMASKSVNIANPADFGMLDIIGFDIGATQIIAKFSLGEV